MIEDEGCEFVSQDLNVYGELKGGCLGCLLVGLEFLNGIGQ